MFRCSNVVSIVPCSNIPLFQYSNVPMFKCSNVPMFKCSNVDKVKLLSERTSGVPPMIFTLRVLKAFLHLWCYQSNCIIIAVQLSHSFWCLVRINNDQSIKLWVLCFLLSPWLGERGWPDHCYFWSNYTNNWFEPEEVCKKKGRSVSLGYQPREPQPLGQKTA